MPVHLQPAELLVLGALQAHRWRSPWQISQDLDMPIAIVRGHLRYLIRKRLVAHGRWGDGRHFPDFCLTDSGHAELARRRTLRLAS